MYRNIKSVLFPTNIERSDSLSWVQIYGSDSMIQIQILCFSEIICGLEFDSSLIGRSRSKLKKKRKKKHEYESLSPIHNI